MSSVNASSNVVNNITVSGVPQGGYYRATTSRNWTTGLLSCCSDCGSCCYECWCPCCNACDITSRLGEPCCLVGCCCYYHCIFGACYNSGLSHMRTKLRTMQKIENDDNICCDIVKMTLCKQCAVCQMAREMKHIGL